MERTFLSIDTIIKERGADRDITEDPQIPAEFLRTLNASGLPLGKFRPKIVSPLILLRNLTPSRGLCKGTRMILHRMSNQLLEAQLIGGKHNGELAFVDV